jgi:hypothetical protein
MLFFAISNCIILFYTVLSQVVLFYLISYLSILVKQTVNFYILNFFLLYLGGEIRELICDLTLKTREKNNSKLKGIFKSKEQKCIKTEKKETHEIQIVF